MQRASELCERKGVFRGVRETHRQKPGQSPVHQEDEELLPGFAKHAQKPSTARGKRSARIMGIGTLLKKLGRKTDVDLHAQKHASKIEKSHDEAKTSKQKNAKANGDGVKQRKNHTSKKNDESQKKSRTGAKQKNKNAHSGHTEKARQRKRRGAKDSDEVFGENAQTSEFDSNDDGPMEQAAFESGSDSEYTESELDHEHEEEEDESENEDFMGGCVFVTDDSNKNEFAVLSPSQIVAEQEEEIKSIGDLLSIDASTAGTLLRHFNWNKEKLLARYFENSQSVCEEAGVGVGTNADAGAAGGTAGSAASAKVVALEGEAICSISDEPTEAEDSTALSCHHRFCNSCWREYLTVKINEGQSTSLHCLQFKCNLRVDESIVKRIVEPEVFDKFARFVITSFVEDNHNVKWCPTPNCGNAIAAELITGITDVRCVCGYRFCFRCHREAHAPAPCEQMKLWELKCQDDSETQNWVQANTKVCPKCDVPTEKNGGCNHMTCRQCKHEWCWVCLRTWKGHNDYYTCNRFEKQKKASSNSKRTLLRRGKSKRQQREDDRQRFRQALERYLHFFERYTNHSNSLKLEQQTREKSLAKMSALQREHMTAVEVAFIQEATECLLQCRSALKYSYVFAFYMNDGPAKHLFEYLQENLEKTTEQLSEQLDTDFPERLQTVNMTQLAETRRLNLINFAENELFQNDNVWSDKPTNPEAFDL
jgi:ariadne-1